jgi:hypothetical protein
MAAVSFPARKASAGRRRQLDRFNWELRTKSLRLGEGFIISGMPVALFPVNHAKRKRLQTLC